MTTETIPSSSSSSSLPPVSTEDSHPLSLPVFLATSSSSLKPLRERNRTNLKRRINLSRSQVLSRDFENDHHPPPSPAAAAATTPHKTARPSSQSSSTPTPHPTAELYSKSQSPTTPSPIHTAVTCSQVWERLASTEEPAACTSPEAIAAVATVSSLPTHISFSYESSDDDDDAAEELTTDDGNTFQYVPLLTDTENDGPHERVENRTSDESMDENNHDAEEQPEEGDDDGDQENRVCKKRKRSVSTTNSLDDTCALPSARGNEASSTPVSKPPCTKKPKIKDPNANFQLLNMRKKSYSHAKKHQFGKNKRNAFYRRTRHAGGQK